MKLRLLCLLLAAAALTGCSDETGLSTAVTPDEFSRGTVALGKKAGSTGNLDTDSRARIVFSEDEPMKIVSDGLLGADGTSAYVGNECGVEAKLFYYNEDKSRSGDLVFDADMNRSKCARALVFRFPSDDGGDFKAAPFINVNKSMQMGATGNDLLVAVNIQDPEYYGPRDNPVSRTMKFAIGKSLCETLTYDHVLVSRTGGHFDDPDGDGWGQWDKDAGDPGSWTVESVASPDGFHAATCTYTKERTTQVGATYDMPFRFQVTEKPVW